MPMRGVPLWRGFSGRVTDKVAAELPWILVPSAKKDHQKDLQATQVFPLIPNWTGNRLGEYK